jgi:hypothetical protein
MNSGSSTVLAGAGGGRDKLSRLGHILSFLPGPGYGGRTHSDALVALAPRVRRRAHALLRGGGGSLRDGLRVVALRQLQQR